MRWPTRSIHSKHNNVGLPKIEDEWENHCLGESEWHPYAVTLGVQEDEVLGLVHKLEHQEESARPVVRCFSKFGVGSEAFEWYCCHGGDPQRHAEGLELDPEVGLVVIGHCEGEFFFIGAGLLDFGDVDDDLPWSPLFGNWLHEVYFGVRDISLSLKELQKQILFFVGSGVADVWSSPQDLENAIFG